METADVVGTGYRCLTCSTTNVYELTDHLDPETRDRTKRSLARRVLLHAGILGAIVGAPIIVGIFGGAALGALLGGAAVLYGVPVATATLGIAFANYRRFAKLPVIPNARLLRAPK